MNRLQGWPLTGWIALGLVVMCIGIVLAGGVDEDATRAVVRATARTSLILFSLAFVASSLVVLSLRPTTRWLLRNRRYLGVSFAVSHFLHLGGLVDLALRFPDPFLASRDPAAVAAGALAYLFVAAMAATSTDRSAAWLGPRRWRLLHKIGAYFIWFVFAQQYLFYTLEQPRFLPALLLSLAALGVRLAAWNRSRRGGVA